jgi:hypothetical protein
MRISMLALMVTVTACGSGARLGQDAPLADAPVDAVVDATPDGSPDSAVDAGPAGNATVHVTHDFPAGQPFVGARVAVVDPAISTPVIVTTDATGTAIVPVHPHSRIWVHADEDVQSRLYLIEDVSPGYVINLGPAVPTEPITVDGSVTIHYSELPGEHYYNARFYNRAACHGEIDDPAPGTVTFAWLGGCAVSSRELVVAALDPVAFQPVAYLHVPGVSSGSPGTIDATGLVWDTDLIEYPATFAGLAGVDQAFVGVVSDATWHWPYVPVAVSGGSGSGTLVDSTLLTPATLMYDLQRSPGNWQYGDDPAPTLPADLGIDGTTLLPFIEGVTYTEIDQTLHWTTAVPGALAPQLVTGQTYDTVGHRLRIYAPGTATSLVIPDVPDELTTDDTTWTFVGRDVYLVYAEGSSYSDLLLDVDDHRSHLNERPHRPGQRNRWSGGPY